MMRPLRGHKEVEVGVYAQQRVENRGVAERQLWKLFGMNGLLRDGFGRLKVSRQDHGGPFVLQGKAEPRVHDEG
jgi:hypothetical protein